MGLSMELDITQLQGFTIINNSLTIEQTLSTLPSNYLQLDMDIAPEQDYNVIRTPRVYIDYKRGNILEHREISLTLSSNNHYVSNWQSDLTSLTITIQDAYIVGLASDDIPLVNDFNIIRCYHVNNDIMSQLASLRFFDPDNQGNFIDLGQYILKYTRYPFKIDNADNRGNIQLGFYDTNILSDLPLLQYYDLDLGSVLVQGLYTNNADINNANIILQLPYYGIYNIDSRYINTYIHIIYRVDILSNLCVIYIYSNDILIDNIDCVIGYDIPYIINDLISTKHFNIRDTSIRRIQPKIVVEQAPKINNFYFDVKQYNRLDNIMGYTQCILYDNNICETSQENDLLTDLCNSGIYL